MINRIHIMGGKFLIRTAQHLAGINLPCIITFPFPTSANLQVLNNIYVADTLWKAIQLELHTSVMIGWDPRGLFPRQCTDFQIPNATPFFLLKLIFFFNYPYLKLLALFIHKTREKKSQLIKKYLRRLIKTTTWIFFSCMQLLHISQDFEEGIEAGDASVLKGNLGTLGTPP